MNNQITTFSIDDLLTKQHNILIINHNQVYIFVKDLENVYSYNDIFIELTNNITFKIIKKDINFSGGRGQSPRPFIAYHLVFESTGNDVFFKIRYIDNRKFNNSINYDCSDDMKYSFDWFQMNIV